MSASLAGNREMCELLVANGAVHSAYTRSVKLFYCVYNFVYNNNVMNAELMTNKMIDYSNLKYSNFYHNQLSCSNDFFESQIE